MSFNKLSQLEDLHPLPMPGSLVDKTLKTMAVYWDNLVEYEQFNLSALPYALKASLLSYIGLYGPKEGITSHDLKILFLGDHEMPGATGSEEVSRLDFTGLLSPCFTIYDLRKILTRNNQSDADFVRELEGLSLEANNEQIQVSPSHTHTLFDNINSRSILTDIWRFDLKILPEIHGYQP